MATFRYERTIHFSDTDAAGVVFFARYLAIAHEAYEEALAAHGLPLAEFFRDSGLVIPIVKSEASYLRPLLTGEHIIVDVAPISMSPTGFAIDFTIWKAGPPEKRAAVIRTEHVCIDSASRAKVALPDQLLPWVDSGST